MKFALDREHELFRREVRRFSEREVAPLALGMDRDNEFPSELRPRLVEQEYLGLIVPEEYGGTGAGYLFLTLLLEEMSTVCAAAANHLQLEAVVAEELRDLGTEEQKERYLTPVVRGEKIGAFAFTEPATGSDPRLITTRIEERDGGFVLNGHKRWITAATMADFCIVFARDAEDISFVLVDLDLPGVDRPSRESIIGLRGTGLGDLTFKDVHLPADAVLGGRGGKFAELKKAMMIGKLCLSAQCLGLMQGALDEAFAYSGEREQRGGPIRDMMSIRALLAEMASRLEASRWLTYRVAALKDAGESTLLDAAMMKLFVTQTAVDVTRMGVQVHGVYGLSKDQRIERLFRDAKTYELLEGSSEIQRELVARGLERAYD